MIPMDEARLQTELVEPNGPYARVDLVAETGSTNADLAQAASSARDRTALIAERQTAGRGRRTRSWSSPEGRGVYLSVLTRPVGVPSANTASLSLVAGLALLDVARHAGVGAAAVKWPNDLLIDGAKAAGVLAEKAEDAIVVGIGLNVFPVGDVELGPGGLPATSLAEHTASDPDRTELAVELLRAFSVREHHWRAAGGRLTGGALDEYKRNCASIGAAVKVDLPGATELSGSAVDIDTDGMLVVETGDGRTTVAAGDVIHVR